jgi:5,10-methylene-tetrahydrofolate dehydrogenase/methenyl tetrahydrofolate cyclohydrolase
VPLPHQWSGLPTSSPPTEHEQQRRGPARRKLACDDTVGGILVQHPMPPQVDGRQVFEAITAAKDVDGVTAASFTSMALGTVTSQNPCHRLNSDVT